MMKRLDQRGVAALEFCLVAASLFTLMFVIFDLGRYAITTQSLRTLANAGARATMIKCYAPAAIAKSSPSNCTDIDTYFPDAQRRSAAPFVYRVGATPTLHISSGASALTVAASQSFTPVVPVWGTALNAPSASTKIPF